MKTHQTFLIFFLSLSAALPAFAEKTEVRIGVILPLSGDMAIYGADAARIVPTLEREWSAASSKYTYRLIMEDGRCGVGNAAVTAAQKLLNFDKVALLVVGCSGEILQVAPLAERSKVVTIAYAASHPDVSGAGDFVFRTYVDIRKGLSQIVRLMLMRPDSRVALITEETSFTSGIRDHFRQELGARVIFSEDYAVQDADLRPIFLKAQAAKPTLYYFNAASPKSYLTMFNQARELGIREPIFTYHMPADAAVLKALGTAQDGVVFIGVGIFKDTSPEFQRLFTKYLEQYSAGPVIEILLRTSYDALDAAHRAIESVGTDAERIRDFLYSASWLGGSGPIAFDQNGDVKELDFALRTIINGEPQLIGGSEQILR